MVLHSAYSSLGRFDDAAAVAELALARDPESAFWNGEMVDCLGRQRAPRARIEPYLRAYVAAGESDASAESDRDVASNGWIRFLGRALSLASQFGERPIPPDGFANYLNQLGSNEQRRRECAAATVRRWDADGSKRGITKRAPRAACPS